MNLSEIITELKLHLGIMGIKLPFENGDDIFKYVIENITLKYYSLNQPCYEKIDFDISKLEKIRSTPNSTTYLLPNVFDNRVILFVRDVQYSETDVAAYPYYGGIPLEYGMVRDNMLANAGANLISAMLPKMTFDFKGPRELTLYNAINSAKITVEIAFQHNKNLSSIEETCRESFMELALLDMKYVLYNALKHYDNIPSASGTIQLHIDDWQGAEAERKELLGTWSELYVLDVANFVYV